MDKNNLAFIDIETTGLNVIMHEIIEIGVVVTTVDLKIIEEFDLKIRPENIENADPASLKVNHYDSENWKEAVSLKEAMQIVATKTKDSIMIGQNVAFDSGFLEHAFAKTNIKNSMHYHKLDTISIAWAKLHGDPTLTHFSLRELCARFGIVIENAHTGLGDARATHKLYKKLMEL